MSLVVLGHVDAGKSTLAGRLLAECKCVSPDVLAGHFRAAEAAGMSSHKYAWILDNLKTERERGITIDISMWKFDTAKIDYTIVDAPGHRDFVKNAITGTSQADCALLVVDCSSEGYAAGMARDGQTREHALLAYTLGVKQVVVAMNKLDHASIAAGHRRGRYDELKGEVAAFLKKVGYKSSRVSFVPVSAWEGANLTTTDSALTLMPWYRGPTLLDALDAVAPPKRPVDKPLRIPIQDVYKIGGVGTVPVGRVEAGVLKPGITANFAPSNVTANVVSLERHHETLDQAAPGDNVGFHVQNIAATDVRRGDVASDAADGKRAARRARSFTAQIVVMNHPGEITEGYAPVIDCHTTHVACKFVQIIDKLDRRTGKKIQDTNVNTNNGSSPSSLVLKNGDAALVRMEPRRPMCVEAFGDFPPLGRFAVRDMKRTVAVGVIKEVVFYNDDDEEEDEKEEEGDKEE